VTEVDKGTQNQSNVPIDEIIIARDDYFMTCVPEDRAQISNLDTGHVLKDPAKILRQASCH
jgi:hypothetical protein